MLSHWSLFLVFVYQCFCTKPTSGGGEQPETGDSTMKPCVHLRDKAAGCYERTVFLTNQGHFT